MLMTVVQDLPSVWAWLGFNKTIGYTWFPRRLCHGSFGCRSLGGHEDHIFDFPVAFDEPRSCISAH